MNDEAGEANILVLNKTEFFSAEMLLRSFGDIRFKKPISLKRVVYILVFCLLWSGPIIYFTGVTLDFYWAFFVFGPPIGLGYYASKPVWGGGYQLLPYLRILAYYLRCPRGWSDLRKDNYQEDTVFRVEDTIWVSRRRELNKLAAIKEARIKAKKRNKRRR